MTSFTIWLKLHFETLATQHLIAGTLTAWALWKALQPWLADFKDPARDFRKRVLASPATTEYLVAGLLLTGFLFFTTASVTLRLTGTDISPVTVRLTDDDGKAILQDLTLTTLTPAVSRPLFGRFRATRATAHIVDPPGYDPKPPFTLNPWLPVTVHFPGHFTKHAYHVVRIVPGISLARPLKTDQHTLTITGPDGTPHDFPDYRYQTLYLGAAMPDLNRLVPTYSIEEFQRELHGHLVKRQVPTEGHDEYLTTWMQSSSKLATPEYAASTTLLLTITRPNKPPLIDKRPVIINDAPLTSTVIEVTP